MSELSLGVIGVGYLGQHHARIFKELPEVNLVGVCDISIAQGKEIAKKYQTNFYKDRSDLLAKVDAVSVAVPTPFHYEVAQDVLFKGKHLLLEKPIAESVSQAEKLIEIANKEKLLLQIGHIERFNPAIIASLPLVKSPLFIEAHRLAPFKNRGVDVPVIYDLMVHDIDIVLSCVNSVIKRIEAVGVPVLSKEFDIANARIEFENGTIANFTTSRVSREKMRKIRFFQTDSYISIDYLNHSAEYYKREFKDETPFISREEIDITDAEPLKLELQSFVESIRNKTAPKVTALEAKKALSVANKIVRKIVDRKDVIEQRFNEHR